MPFAVFAAPLLSENAMGMVRAAASLEGVQLAVITHDPAEKLGELRDTVAHWRVSNVLDTNQLVWAAEELARRHGAIDQLFGAYEQLQVPLAEARGRLGVRGMSVEAATNFRDKAQMKTVLRANGLPCARHALARSLADAAAFAESSGFPMVVKPPSGAGAQQTFRADDMDTLRKALAAAPPTAATPVLMEEFVVGVEHSFETISVDGKAVWHSLTHYYPTPLDVLRNPWIQWCLVLPREVDGPQYDDIRQAARHALEVLGMDTGLSHMEWFRRADGSIALSEVAARPPGAQITTLMSVAHDIDIVKAWARLMIFNTFDIPERRYAAGAAFLRGQGQGRVKAVHGIDQVKAELGEVVVSAKIPKAGDESSSSYEGEGWVIVRHPETRVVEKAVARIVALVKVELV